jgi:hypothetical protein
MRTDKRSDERCLYLVGHTPTQRTVQFSFHFELLICIPPPPLGAGSLSSMPIFLQI